MKDSQEIPVRVAFNPLALATADKKASAELLDLVDATIDNDDDARDCNAELVARVRDSKAVDEMLANTLAPLKEAEARVKALFDPTRNTLKGIVHKLRTLLEGYELEKRVAQRQALDDAAKAAALPTATALTSALQRVEDAAPTALEGTSFVRTWLVKRYAAGCVAQDGKHRTAQTMIPDEFWIVDEKALAAVGRKHKFDEPPVVPGVVWAEELSSRVRT